jgi:hypothetical protein
MDTWPSTLPQYVEQDSFSETIRNPVVSTEMDAGPKKYRLRYTAVPEMFTISMVLTSAERLIFLAFYKVNLHYGVDEFTWVHPVSQETATCRFTGLYNIVPNGLDFTMSIEMEIVL